MLQLDIVAFANLAQLHFIDKEVQHALRDALNESFPNLVGLVSRIKERAYPDWDEICAIETAAAVAKKEKENKEGTGPAEKQAIPDDAEKGKVCKIYHSRNSLLGTVLSFCAFTRK